MSFVEKQKKIDNSERECEEQRERNKCRVLGLGLCLCPGFYFLFFLTQ